MTQLTLPFEQLSGVAIIKMVHELSLLRNCRKYSVLLVDDILADWPGHAAQIGELTLHFCNSWEDILTDQSSDVF